MFRSRCKHRTTTDTRRETYIWSYVRVQIVPSKNETAASDHRPADTLLLEASTLTSRPKYRVPYWFERESFRSRELRFQFFGTG